MQIDRINQTIIGEGKNLGKPAIIVGFNEKAPKRTANEVVDEIKKLSLPDVLIAGSLHKHPEIKVLSSALTSINKRVIFKADASEDVSPLRIIPNISFYLWARTPSSENVSIARKNIGLLKETDTVRFKLSTKENFERIVAYLKSFSIQKPEIVFLYSSKTAKMDEQEATELFLAYASKTHLRTRISFTA